MIDFYSIISFFELNSLSAYLVLFFMMVWEGETFLIIAGVLSHLGALKLNYVIAIAFIGTMLGDIFWYALGMFLSHERTPSFLKKIVGISEKIVDRFVPHLKTKPVVSLVLAKFIYGTNHATLILSGVRRMNFILYIKAEIIATALWVLVFSFLGYFFGYAAIQISNKITVSLLFIVIFIVSFMAIQRYLSFYYENKKNKI